MGLLSKTNVMLKSPPFTIATITSKVLVYAQADKADRYTPTISTLPLYVLCGLYIKHTALIKWKVHIRPNRYFSMVLSGERYDYKGCRRGQ